MDLLIMAKHFLDRAKGNLEIDYYDVAFLMAYNSMFHAMRYLLLKSGYKERGHYALIEALKHIYKNNSKMIEYLDILDNYRMTRHAIQYSGELSTELNAVRSIKDAEAIFQFVKKSINIENKK